MCTLEGIGKHVEERKGVQMDRRIQALSYKRRLECSAIRGGEKEKEKVVAQRGCSLGCAVASVATSADFILSNCFHLCFGITCCI